MASPVFFDILTCVLITYKSKVRAVVAIRRLQVLFALARGFECFEGNHAIRSHPIEESIVDLRYNSSYYFPTDLS